MIVRMMTHSKTNHLTNQTAARRKQFVPESIKRLEGSSFFSASVIRCPFRCPGILQLFFSLSNFVNFQQFVSSILKKNKSNQFQPLQKKSKSKCNICLMAFYIFMIKTILNLPIFSSSIALHSKATQIIFQCVVIEIAIVWFLEVMMLALGVASLRLVEQKPQLIL